MERVTDLADPNRCKVTVNGNNQCFHVAVPGENYCELHSHKPAGAAERDIYYLTKARHRHRLTQLRDHEEIKSLREEIALTRILIEERWNQATSDADLLLACPMLNQLLLTLERLIKSSHQIEQNLGTLLSKSAVVTLGQSLVQLLIEELKQVPNYEEVIDRITDKLFNTIDKTVSSASQAG